MPDILRRELRKSGGRLGVKKKNLILSKIISEIQIAKNRKVPVYVCTRELAKIKILEKKVFKTTL